MIHIYTGNGKGKTTAALGLALRAAGAGLKVYIGQFIKGNRYSELNSLKKLKDIKVEQFGRACFIKKLPAQKDIELAKRGLEKINAVISRRNYDMVILDEICVALKFNLLAIKDVVSLMEKAPKKMELVLTGRYACAQIIRRADLVSEMKEIKHYYKSGKKARKGIEF